MLTNRCTEARRSSNEKIRLAAAWPQGHRFVAMTTQHSLKLLLAAYRYVLTLEAGGTK